MEVSKCLKFPPLNLVVWACADECEYVQMNFLLHRVTEGVSYGVYKVVTLLSFGVTWRHNVSGGKLIFCHCVTRLHMKKKPFRQMLITVYTHHQVKPLTI